MGVEGRVGGGGVRSGLGVQGRCNREQRIQKINSVCVGGGEGSGWGVRVDVNEELIFLF